MAYRFNPPPNWPIDDASWSPPPGWQPDPSWGPAPEGWNFWVTQEQAPAAQPEQSEQPAQPEQPGAPVAQIDDDATHVAGTDDQPAAPAPAEQPAEAEGAQSTGQYGAMNPYGAAPARSDDAQPDAGPQSPEAPVSEAQDSIAAPAEQEPAAHEGASAQTAEYGGPDLEADLAQQAPYETADGGQGAEYGAATGAAAGATAAAGQPDAYGQAQPAPAYGQASPAYGQQSPAQGYGPQSPAQGYGQEYPAHGYGQQSPAQGYGPGSGPAHPGQGSASDYPAPGYGQQSPGVDTGSGWTASTGAGEPPKKGIIQRFWWVGCLLILLLVLILIAVGGFLLLGRGGDDPAGTGGGQTTTQEQTTEEEPVTDEPTDEAAEDETEWPTDLPTIDPEAEKDAVSIVGMDGTGTMAVDMAYIAASDLERTYGGAMEEPENGDEYLVLTAKLTVGEGELGLNPHQFSVVTPYGGEISPASASYGLKGSGTDGPMDFTEGDEYTIKILFDVKRAKDNTLNFTTFTDDYTWDVPA